MTQEKFAARSPGDIARLVRSHPLAWIISLGTGEPCATLLPMRPVEVDGRVEGLAGHFARSNPQLQVLKTQPRVLIFFLGVHGYVSPSWMADRTQAPTWNYASAQFDADIELFEEPARIETHLRDLVTTQEAGRPGGWMIDEMGPRYHSLSRGVIGFLARVRATRARFKLGQDERDDVFSDIVRGLERQGSTELVDWMREFNEHRHGREE
ncbi:MAG: FMN-binding negative transcriptional regulator [Gammaproteobacteria bacterium]|nr:FMN-binding negative transcriptional regulator [Gammaproteobacteria bacterium]